MTDVTIREVHDLRELEDEHPAPRRATEAEREAEMAGKLAEAHALIAKARADGVI